MKRLFVIALCLAAGPALAADAPFFSLRNTNFITTLAFLVFVGIVIYAKVPGLIGGWLDKRAAGIASELEEARALREEAKEILASYQKKQREVGAQVDRIVELARQEATAALDKGRADLEASVERRLAAAEEQLRSAEETALRDIREQAATLAVGVAADVLAAQQSPENAREGMDRALDEIERRLH